MKLDAWQRNVLAQLQRQVFPLPSIENVTVLAYFFWDDDRIDSLFYQIQCAFLSTFACVGVLPASLVVNRATKRMRSFCDKYGIDVQVDSSLTGGIKCMSLDCIKNLHDRFMTDYVLIVQTDGFVLRPGLGDFLGEYDYIGAPWPKPSWYTNRVFPHPRFCVGNGGFSLRSKKICEMASHCYKKKYKLMPYSWFMVEDVYYCRVLPRFEKGVRKTIQFAPPDVAGRFSFEANRDFYKRGEEMPLGFHAPHGFRQVYTDYKDLIDVHLGLNSADGE